MSVTLKRRSRVYVFLNVLIFIRIHWAGGGGVGLIGLLSYQYFDELI